MFDYPMLAGSGVWAVFLVPISPRRRCSPWCASHAILFLFTAASVLTSCDRGPKQGVGAFGRADTTIRPDGNDVTLRVPRESCFRSVGSVGHLEETASIVPVEYRKIAQPQDSGWLPVRLVDVAPFGHRLLVLDAGGRTVTIFGPDFRTRQTVGREGAGPGEFRNPLAVAVDSVTGHIFVADPGNGRVAILDSLGAPVEVLHTDATDIEDLAVGTNALLFAHFILPEMLPREPRFGYVLTTQTRDQGVITPIVTAKVGALDPVQYPLPGPNPFRVVQTGGYAILFSPATGTMDVYRGTEHMGRLRPCMPQALAQAYAKQLELHATGRRGNSQQWFPLLTDVLVRADTVYTVGPMPDKGKRFHVDRFLLDGTELSSLVASAENLPFPEEVRFWGSPYDFVAFGSHGTIMRLRFMEGP
jgi:hypothetical protein